MKQGQGHRDRDIRARLRKSWQAWLAASQRRQVRRVALWDPRALPTQPERSMRPLKRQASRGGICGRGSRGRSNVWDACRQHNP